MRYNFLQFHVLTGEPNILFIRGQTHFTDKGFFSISYRHFAYTQTISSLPSIPQNLSEAYLFMYTIAFYEDVPHKLCTSSLFMKMSLISYAHSLHRVNSIMPETEELVVRRIRVKIAPNVVKASKLVPMKFIT